MFAALAMNAGNPVRFSPMFQRYRHRRGPYALAAPSIWPSILRKVLAWVVILFIVWKAGAYVVRWVSGGGGEKVAAQLVIEQGGTVNVGLDGGLMQRAVSGLPMHEGDKISTSAGGHAQLTFFDGTRIRLDEQTELTLDRNRKSDDEGTVHVNIAHGGVWIDTTAAAQQSIVIDRTLTTTAFTATVPTSVQALIEDRFVAVLSADDEDISVATRSPKDEIDIGEGQQLSLPAKIEEKLTHYRTAVTPALLARSFIIQSKRMAPTGSGSTVGSGALIPTGSDTLTLLAPPENATITAPTVVVQGKAGTMVNSVRVNGYLATIDPVQRTFREELAMRDAPTMDILVEALDEKGIVLDELTRTVKYVKTTAEGPTIVEPAGNNQVYRTQKVEFVIRGTVPAHTKTVMVNDYVLQLYKPGGLTWSYLASKALTNLKDGSNVFNVIAIDDAGNRSVPATITILLEEGTEGVIGGTTSSGKSTAAASSTSSVSEEQLPQNAPLTPGTLSVTGPTAGTQHTATGSEFVLVGATSTATDSVWINGYRLQLYKAGKTFWNYIAKVEYKTLKVGTNIYKIHARNAKGELLDSLEYTVEYHP